MKVCKDSEDRRGSNRFEIDQELHFKVLGRINDDGFGEGRTVNFSSSGILFRSDVALPTGRRVELSVNWPAKLDQKCGLKLVARGRVVRYEGGCTAIEIQQHEFRTQSRGPALKALATQRLPA